MYLMALRNVLSGSPCCRSAHFLMSSTTGAERSRRTARMRASAASRSAPVSACGFGRSRSTSYNLPSCERGHSAHSCTHLRPA